MITLKSLTFKNTTLKKLISQKLKLKSSEIHLRLKTEILPTQTAEKLLFWQPVY
jgi:hypothetical protein